MLRLPLRVVHVSLRGTRSALPLPPVRGFPTLRVLPAGPTSIAASASPMDGPFRRRTPFAKTTMDLPGSATLPFPSCRALRPRRGLRFPSPVSEIYYSLPSFRPCRPPVVLTRLNRFTCVTARTSLCLRLPRVVTFAGPRLDCG